MISRRRFLVQSSVAAGALSLPAFVRSASPNRRLALAFIACGGRGGANLREMTRQDTADVVALCDVNQKAVDQASQQFPKARTYRDFRKLYDDAKAFDAVVVSTPEHIHAYATMPALLLGKHVYCEKPLTYNVEEARRITAAAEKAGVATQMGTQIHGMPNYHRVVELIQSGAIGPVRKVHVWVSRAWGLQSKEEAEKNKDIVYVTERPSEAMTPPAYLDWNLWLGPAPERPFHEVYFPGPKWYRWWDFGNGTMSDLGSHWNDLPYWALKLDAPLSVVTEGPAPHPEIAPASMTAIYEYGPRGDLPACTLQWHQGTHKPAIWKEGGIPQWGNGVLFIGERGMLLSDYGKHVLLPEKDFADFQPPKPFVPDSPGQQQEWLNACVNGTPTASPFSYAGPLTEANHLGNVAFRAGRKIEWDAKNMRIKNDPSAERFLRREPRAGWTLG